MLFTDYIAEHLSADGRGGVIVPNGIVATTQNAYVKLRQFLVEDSLVAVISLPSGVFKPYSGVKTSILLLDKKLARRSKEILFLKITADGFDLGDKRNPIEANDLPEAERVVKLWLAGKLNEGTESTVAWKAVEKKTLLEHRACNLQSDPYLGGTSLSDDIESKPLEELLHFMRNGSNVEQVEERKKYRVSRIQSIADGVFDLEKTKWTDDKVSSDRFLQPGDILLSHINSMAHLAKTAIFTGSDVPVIHGINLLCLRPRTDIVLPEYLIRALKHPAFIEASKRFAKPAVNQASVASGDLKQIEIPLPPLEEQRRIVAEIEGYQKVLDGARQIIKSHSPRLEVKPDWPTTTIKEVARVVSGHGFPLEHQGETDAEIPFYKVSDMNLPGNERFMVSHNNSVSRETLKKLKGRSHPAGTIIFPKIGAAIATNKKRMLTREATFDNNVMGIVPDPEIDPKFLLAWMDGFNLSEWASEAHPPSMRQCTVEDQEIPLPPLPEQRRIVAELDAEAAQMEAVRGLIPRFEAKIQRVLDRVWGNGVETPP